jgi:hypothetical protein
MVQRHILSPYAAVKKSTYPCTGCYCTQITSMSQGRKFVTSVHKILHSTFINHKLMTLMQKGGMWHLFTFTTIQTFQKERFVFISPENK